MVVWRGRLPKVEARIAKHGPWGNLIFVLAAVYGPRLVMLWNRLGEQHKNKMRPVAVISARERAEPIIDPGEKVN